jgi:RNA polymerase-binding transcription factor DksA
MAAAKKTSSTKKTTPKKAATKKAATKKVPAKKAPAKKAPAKKAPAKKAPAKKAPAKKAPAKKAPAKKAPAKKSPAKKAPAKKAPAKKAPAKKGPAKKVPAKKVPAKKVPAKKVPAKKAPAKKAPTKKAPTKKAPTKKAPAKKKTVRKGSTNETPSLLSNARFERVKLPKPRGKTKDGVSYTKDFDVKFLKAQRSELLARRAAEIARATRLEDEATSLIEDGEMGDVQFDDEGGEGDTMVVQRDLDRVISTQSRQTILDIDAALLRIEDGTYGFSEVSGLPIQRERLEAIPETTVRAAEKVSGAGPR